MCERGSVAGPGGVYGVFQKRGVRHWSEVAWCQCISGGARYMSQQVQTLTPPVTDTPPQPSATPPPSAHTPSWLRPCPGGVSLLIIGPTAMRYLALVQLHLHPLLEQTAHLHARVVLECLPRCLLSAGVPAFTHTSSPPPPPPLALAPTYIVLAHPPLPTPLLSIPNHSTQQTKPRHNSLSTTTSTTATHKTVLQGFTTTTTYYYHLVVLYVDLYSNQPTKTPHKPHNGRHILLRPA